MLEVDYSKIDGIMEDIIDRVCKYMKNVPEELIKHLIMKAYIFAKEAHH